MNTPEPPALPLAELLGYRDRVPVTWQELGELPDAAQLAHWQDHNLRLLAGAALLEERPRRADADDPTAVEIERLHHKFDMALELLAALLHQQAPPPPTTAARITPQGVSWQTERLPQEGSLILLHLHLHPGLPSPLIWPAEALANVGDEASAWFLSLGEPCALAIERHVFIRHRRSVADARSPAARSEPPAPH